MEVSGSENENPELVVETVQVRRNSNSAGDHQILPPPCEIGPESIKPAPKISPDLNEAQKESELRRVDSESKFGAMETIPLELSCMEVSSMQVPTKEASENVSAEATTAPENVLSKYFGSDPLQEKLDSDGVSFFNALAEGPVVCNTPPEIIHSTTQSSGCVEKAEVAQEIFEDSTSEKDHTKNPPTLFKFFAEDKSGNDQDGKAFFDKIAEVKTIESFHTLEMKETVISTDTKEPFLNSPLSGGEIEDAWLSSERTRNVLVSIITSKSPVNIDKSLLTMPGIVVDKDMVDPVKALLIECNSPQAQLRKTLTVCDVSVDEAGLQKLMEAGCYHAAINLTRHILKSCGQGPETDGKPTKHMPLSLRVWYTRLALFVKLKKFNLAEAESASFGDLDKPDLYYEYYPDIYKGKRGTMVPFAFRLLLAELPQYQGNHQVTLDSLYRLLNIIQKMIKNVQNGCAEDGSMIELSESRRSASLNVWTSRERRVLYSILNCVLALKDYILAVSIANILIEKSENEKPQLQSALGRIYLQLGDVKYAEECFNKAALLAEEKSENFQVQVNINKALLAVAQNNNEDALKFYEQAYSLDPKNAMVANNMAVCLLYMGKLKNSLSLLEKTIISDPIMCIHDGLIFNLCTLYELESSRSNAKKVGMLELVSKYVGDSFNVSCLKIQSTTKA